MQRKAVFNAFQTPGGRTFVHITVDFLAMVWPTEQLQDALRVSALATEKIIKSRQLPNHHAKQYFMLGADPLQNITICQPISFNCNNF
jgi:hypothetical protein